MTSGLGRDLRVLVVEDEFLLACSLEEDLVSLGFSVVGPYSGTRQAKNAADNEALDLAVLDVNLNGEMVYPIANRMVERGIPTIFLTGYSPPALHPKFSRIPVLAKPYERSKLESLIERLTGR